jgi:hypothetical protein
VKRWWLVAAVFAAACSGQRARPAGPPPEYEAPVVMPWDAGKPVDPLNSAEGEWVDEADEAGASDAEIDADRP